MHLLVISDKRIPRFVLFSQFKLTRGYEHILQNFIGILLCAEFLQGT
jgi:hypothetical protein